MPIKTVERVCSVAERRFAGYLWMDMEWIGIRAGVVLTRLSTAKLRVAAKGAVFRWSASAVLRY